jgi:hypothetical protein
MKRELPAYTGVSGLLLRESEIFTGETASARASARIARAQLHPRAIRISIKRAIGNFSPGGGRGRENFRFNSDTKSAPSLGTAKLCDIRECTDSAQVPLFIAVRRFADRVSNAADVNKPSLIFRPAICS